MAEKFKPFAGYYRVGRYNKPNNSFEIIDVHGDTIGYVERGWAEALDTTKLFAASSHMLDTLVRLHNNLNLIDGTHHDAPMLARSMQESIRGCLVKMTGDADMIHRIEGHPLVMPK